LGIINSHFSLLPEWRGADPITFSILSGQQRTGVSLMLLVKAMDAGPLLGYGEYDLPATITTPGLTSDLIELSFALLKTIVPDYLEGKVVPRPQDTAVQPTYSRKLTKLDGTLDWHKPATQLEREIRAFIEWPKSRARLGTLDVIVTAAHVVARSGLAGQIIIEGKQLLVQCSQDALVIDTLKPAGKKEMTGESFIAGYKQLLA